MNDTQLVGHFFVNRSKEGRTMIKVKFPDGNVLFLNFKKDSKEQGVVSLGTGGKPYELQSADVKVTFDIKPKAGATAAKGKSYARKTDSDSPF